jgi:L-fucose isomerase-like protein
MEKELGISPCVLLSEMNDRGMVAACELDVCNAIPMYALSIASGKAATCLDWNNNYGMEENKCILFHCGPVPQSLMTAKGQVIEHPMFAKSFGAGCGWGCNVGRIAASPMTYASSKTEDGKLIFYLGEGRFTSDEIENGFFGCAGVAEIPQLQEKLLAIGKQGFRHHVGVTFGNVAMPVKEAFTNYLGYDIINL